MNIAIGKIGRSCLFDPNKWGAIGGDNEPSLIFLALAKHLPEHNFYMIGHSDIKQNRQRIPKNIIDAWDGKTREHDYTYPYINTKHIKFDGGIFMCGLSAKFNIPNKDNKILSMFKTYTAPIYHFINEHNLNYMLLAPDPRYIKNGLDLRVPAKYCFSQFSMTHFHEHYINNTDIITSSFEVGYNSLEKAFLIGNKPCENVKKTDRLNIILNQKGTKDRGPILMPFIKDEFCNVYGKWDDWYYDNDPRFKGPVKFIELRQKLVKTKYSFIVPVEEGWVTSKFWEMVHMGVIPFMHPSYDTKCYLPCSNELKVHSPKEFKDIMDFYDEHDDKRQLLIKALQEYIFKDDYSGVYLAYSIINTFYNKVKGWK